MTAGVRKPELPGLMIAHDGAVETRWDAMPRLGCDTPNDRFFVRNHTRTPEIDAAPWRLRVFGSGLQGRPGYDRAVEFGYRDLVAMPAVSARVLMECTGNGRALFERQQGEPVPGTPWELGAVGVATWTGVRLRTLLEWAGIAPDAVDLLPRGLDDEFVDRGVNHGRVRRPLPVWKAMDDVLVAYEMNGEPLPPDHGFPARLVVPHWVGVASIKWLGDIEVSDTPLFSPWNTVFYQLGGDPLTTLVPKSVFELPWLARLTAGRTHRLRGRAWAGEAAIARVEVSSDAGATWEQAELIEDGPWVRWQTDWCPPAPGRYTLIARAVDQRGQVQPDRAPPNPLGYLFGAVVRHQVVAT